MLSVHCPRHHADVLIGHRQILGIDGSGADLTVRWECWCGYRGRTARRGPADPATATL
jgi:hypothetical protein